MTSFLTCYLLLALQGNPTPMYQEIWVDIQNGNDTTGGGHVAAPYQTIGKALAVANPGVPTVINLKPGRYKLASTLFMKSNVSIQGAGALDTIIESLDDPIILLSFMAGQANAFDNVFVDGVNIRAGTVGIEITNNATTERFAANPTVSNCFLTDHEVAAIDIVSVPGGAGIDDLDADPFVDPGGAFIEHRPQIVHCTFRMNNIGIRNRTSTAIGGVSYGVNQPGLLNLLMKDQLELDNAPNPGDDLQGIDALDVSIPAFGETVAFLNQGNLPGPVVWDPTIPGPGTPPTPNIFNFGGSANLFVQDVLTPGLLFDHDLRLNPDDAPLVDAGFYPGNTWVWSNNTPGKAKISTLSGSFVYHDIFKFDCEAFGNPRLEGGAPDMGADEMGQFVHAGYRAFTKQTDSAPSMNHIWLPNWGIGSATERAFAGISSSVLPLYIDNNLDIAGTRAKRTSVAGTPVSPYTGVLWIDFNVAITQGNYIAPFGVGSSPFLETPHPVTQSTLFNEQFSVDLALSNLQTYTVLAP